MIENVEKIKQAKEEWLKRQNGKANELDIKFITASSEPVEPLATPDDVKNIDFFNDINFPGEFPYTRGIHSNMYRGKVWTMRQFAGFGTPEDTNKPVQILVVTWPNRTFHRI